MKLRPYQIAVINEVYAAWNRGRKNVLVQLATGAGKTVVFSKIIADNTGASIAIAHRSELVSQISLTLARYGVRHNIIAQKATVRELISIHLAELGKSYYDPGARCAVASVDTLRNLQHSGWFKNVTLVVQDEGHHPLKINKWGKIAALFPNARGLYPTATPMRADGKGLGRHADGIMDVMVKGPSMRDLIDMQYLTDYRIFAPHHAVDLSLVPIAAGGDFSPRKLREAVHKSRIVGDVVSHYLKFGTGKLGVTFAVSIEAAEEITAAYRAASVPVEMISGNTPDFLRAKIMRDFRERRIMQLVNVDILGEGVDVPAIEVVSMARPTNSFAVYSQQFGRALRPMENKSHAIIIDHVGNVFRHGLPDSKNDWSLERRERRYSNAPSDVTPLRTCRNPACLSVYERVKKLCPHCGYFSPPQQRSGPEHVDGDLLELDAEVLEKLRNEKRRIDGPPRIPQNLETIAQLAIAKNHRKRQEQQYELRDKIATWAGYHHRGGEDDSTIYRKFYAQFGVDIATAQVLQIKESTELTKRVKSAIDEIDSKELE